jgi:hypothetical protein
MEKSGPEFFRYAHIWVVSPLYLPFAPPYKEEKEVMHIRNDENSFTRRRLQGRGRLDRERYHPGA